MILVAGATGVLGGTICQQLRTRSDRVRALVRRTSDPAKVAALSATGVECVVGDLKDAASLAAACTGVDTVISTISSTVSRQQGDSLETVDLAGQLALVDAAAAAKVRQLIYISFPEQPEEYALQHAKRAVEHRLATGTMGYTVLRPTFFTEIWLSPFLGFDFPNAKVQAFGSPDATQSWISVADVASFAVAAIGNPKTLGKTFELGGPDPMRFGDVVKLFESISKRTFAVETVPTAAVRAQYDGAPDPMAKTFAALTLNYSRDNVIDTRPALAAMPIKQTTLRDYATRVLG